MNLQPGAFRLEDDPGPFAEALRNPSSRPIATGKAADERGASGLQALVDRFRAETGGRTVAGALPVHVAFPIFGPSLFVASELTAEAQAPSLELGFKRTK